MSITLYNCGVPESIARENVHSIVVVVSAFGKKALLTGDFGYEGYDTPANEVALGQKVGTVDLLKAGHHGIGTASSPDFLDIISPKQIVVSGLNTRSWYLNENARRWADNHNVPVYFTSNIYSMAYLADFSVSGITISTSPIYAQGTYGYSWTNAGNGKYNLRSDIDGTVVSGWTREGDIWYYLDPTNSNYRHTGWLLLGGKYFYFDAQGMMHTGLIEVDGELYFCARFHKEEKVKSEGEMIVGWYKDIYTGNWYYADAKGVLHTGWAQDKVNLGDNWYYFDAYGIMHTAWIDLPDGLYYCDTDGKRLNGWLTIGGYTYYFDHNNNDRMATGWVNPKGTDYYYTKPTGVKAADLGMRLEGWQNVDGQVYYLDPSQDGKMLYRWQEIEGGWYYFGNNGMMQTGWINPQNYDFYYLKPTGTMGGDLGRMQTGFHFIEGYWYYLDPNDGRMAINCERVINGKLYHFDPSGHCTNY